MQEKKGNIMQRKPIFMVHKHQATRLHYDLRLEVEGVLLSWALQELPTKPSKPVIAIQVADHPFWYRHFEGVIPEGNYGAGPVMIWDKGLYQTFIVDHAGSVLSPQKAIKQGCILLWLEGHKLKGGYLLLRVSKKQRWLLLKMEDRYAHHKGRRPTSWNTSVKSGKTLEEILEKYTKKKH